MNTDTGLSCFEKLFLDLSSATVTRFHFVFRGVLLPFTLYLYHVT